MASLTTTAPVKQAAITAVILRCSCPGGPLHPGAACPNPITIDLGTIAYYSRNPLRRWLYQARQFLKRR